jgi:tetraacyldisaccharide 4'-kinase
MSGNKINAPINRLAGVVNEVIHAPDAGRPIVGACLRIAAFFFEAAVRWRSQYYRRQWQRIKKLSCRVVSVGNLTIGGTGKTPLSIYLARLIHDTGHRVAIISRGYRGGAEKTGAVVESGASPFLNARRFGDEATLMARLLAPRPIPILVGRNRIASGRRALADFQPEVILLDDGFQHYRLARDLDIVLLDCQQPLGNGYLLPRGPLREPPSALGRADILVRTRCPPKVHGISAASAGCRLGRITAEIDVKPLFASQHRLVARERLECCSSNGPRSRVFDLKILRGLPVLAFAGIARSDAFRQTVVDLGAELRGWYSFRDHHPFQADDIDAIVNEGCQKGVAALVTTDKDRIRIHDDWIRKLPLLVIGVEIDFGNDTEAFRQLVFNRLDLNNHRKMRR